MRYLLTADEITAQEAYRLGMIQEVTANGASLDKALVIVRMELTSKENVKGLSWGEKSMFFFRKGSALGKAELKFDQAGTGKKWP